MNYQIYILKFDKLFKGYIIIIYIPKMDIIKAFNENNLNIQITIKGSVENPLFRATDIGEVLDIKNIHQNISDFDESEKLFITIDTKGGPQNIIFLTENGLYRTLMKCKKPIAVTFQKWVCNILKEIRLKGKYDLEEEIRKKNEENQRLQDENNRLVSTNGNPIIYIYNTDTRLEKPDLKIGVTEKYRERSKQYKTSHPFGRMEFSIDIPADINLKTVESWIHYILDKHRLKGEVFGLSIDEAKKQIIRVVNSLLLSSIKNDDERIEKLNKLIDHETIVIHNIPNSELSTQTIAIQTDLNSDYKLIDNNITKKFYTKFDEYIDKCCELDENYEVPSDNIIGQYRIWTKSADKEVYHALLDYLATRFRPIRVKNQDMENIVYGYRGVRLKELNYVQSFAPSDPETFIFNICKFCPNGKILQANIIKEYSIWKKRLNKQELPDDAKILKNYLKNCEYILLSNLWTTNGNGMGYYGLCLRSQENLNRNSSSTSKAVEKRNINTNDIIGSWNTISKAAHEEGISSTKMSRIIKNKIQLNDYYYCEALKKS